MFMGRISPTFVMALAVAVLPSAVASAQAISGEPQPASVRRPYRGLFGGASDPQSPQSLVFSGSLYGAYDDNVLAGLTDRFARDWRYQRSGYYGGAQAGLSYSLSRTVHRFSIAGQTAAQVAYYHRGDDSQVSPYYQGGLSVGTRLSRSTTLSTTQRVAYSPTYSASLIPVAGDAFTDESLNDSFDAVDPAFDAVDPDLELFRLQALRAYTTVGLSQSFGRNTTLTAGYRYRYVDFRGETDDASRFLDYQAHSASAGVSHQRRLTSHGVLNLGYGVRGTDRNSPTGEPRVLHNIDAGVSYSRALSFSRRTSVSFATGSAVAVRERLDVPDGDSRALARLTGNAALVHELGRTWTAQLSYRRGFVFREDFADEFHFMDAVTASVGGLVNRRVSVSAAGMWATSTLERPGGNRHNRLSATAQATYGLTRYLGVFARYVYYELDYGGGVALDSQVPRKLDRQGVRVGLTTSIPLIR